MGGSSTVDRSTDIHSLSVAGWIASEEDTSARDLGVQYDPPESHLKSGPISEGQTERLNHSTLYPCCAATNVRSWLLWATAGPPQLFLSAVLSSLTPPSPHWQPPVDHILPSLDEGETNLRSGPVGAVVTYY